MINVILWWQSVCRAMGRCMWLAIFSFEEEKKVPMDTRADPHRVKPPALVRQWSTSFTFYIFCDLLTITIGNNFLDILVL